MYLLTEDEVLTIRRRLSSTTLAQRAFGATDPVYPDRFSSAVARQHAGYGTFLKYTSPAEVAATLFYGLNMNHSFENGNKRTALVTMMISLDRNSILLVDTTEDDLYDMATMTAAHHLGVPRGDPEVEHIATWIDSRTRPTQLGERRMRFRELRAILGDQGCEFDTPKGNAIKIHRQTPDGAHASVKAGYPNEHHEVPLGEIRRIRRALGLDQASGVDSGSFYDFEASVDEFVNDYRQLMNRLADF